MNKLQTIWLFTNLLRMSVNFSLKSISLQHLKIGYKFFVFFNVMDFHGMSNFSHLSVFSPNINQHHHGSISLVFHSQRMKFIHHQLVIDGKH
jgi:hypothetical protein